MANDSGKYSGENRISCRGRKYLRYVLYKAAILLIGKNVQFWDIHKYYQNEKENPLKKRQLVVVATCKVIRVFYVILTKEAYYDAEKLI
ncbi:MAG: IS110 family transposase [Lachnospiraceae bacterium]|nr:IS110 family transposase [Lachnospiraceae bacterium]